MYMYMCVDSVCVMFVYMYVYYTVLCLFQGP